MTKRTHCSLVVSFGAISANQTTAPRFGFLTHSFLVKDKIKAFGSIQTRKGVWRSQHRGQWRISSQSFVKAKKKRVWWLFSRRWFIETIRLWATILDWWGIMELIHVFHNYQEIIAELSLFKDLSNAKEWSLLCAEQSGDAKEQTNVFLLQAIAIIMT